MEVVLGEDIILQAIIAPKGDDVTLLLTENGSTGYIWEVSSVPGVTTHREVVKSEETEEGVVGGSYQVRLRVPQPEGSERAQLTLLLRRPWEDGQWERKIVVTLVWEDTVVEGGEKDE